MDKAKEKVQRFRAREQRILDAALELLLEHGEEKVTVEQIADRVDIGKGTIYKHFVSKTEIYMRLLMDYERSLAERLKVAVGNAERGDIAAPARAYFESRMADPGKDRLFQRLEEKIIALNQAPEMIAELHTIRNAIASALNRVFERRMEQGMIKRVPAYYYYSTYWALVQGAVELYHSKSFADVIEDREGLMEFIMDVGVHIGDISARKPQETSHSGDIAGPSFG
ncbi:MULTISPECIES: TetR/AcrR family transcriptional regulator [unclassified Microbulbifer]|uniref:TetR/AcrR family transcriptional regulator n=1 Tax=Microbulbifer spongiae TaxID=2944933 RepID=A0ABY9EGE6_9GAMM|nr:MULTISPECIES: TetR/AcrR family transcriptional regulator [unclassified Microbulbifer]MDP5209054.1 TetR/AcrR family transcriptional regulator [Microbulbifer sp. 2205BS26-8]WKD51151.1 TetR/AcrR family transcriptional regulator [Microbulbifer sp. MI-G]